MKPFQGKELIRNAKFYQYETCHCHGKLTYKFKKIKSAKEIWVCPEIGTYSFLIGGKIQRSGMLSKLTQTIINDYSNAAS